MSFTSFTAVRPDPNYTTITFTWAWSGTTPDHFRIIGANGFINRLVSSGVATTANDDLNWWHAESVTITAFDASDVSLGTSSAVALSASPPTLAAPTGVVAGLNASGEVTVYFTPPSGAGTWP